ncbi:DSD1 family PLP-dependent enzyme [Paucibacter soli]|uniref:DSD1 family PLP-dependent enzyme n=1 Tax=Paucibacter soli TaxID=3133433 RepID=UPI0030B1869E
MTQALTLPPPARIGDPLAAIDTPALLLELDAFERNLDRMQAAASAAGVALRPHAKAHKCPAIALAQLQRGAQGICCQKVSEALPFVQAGVRDIHISNEIGGAAKAALLAQLALHARMSVCVDHLQQIEMLAAATRAAASRLDVLVEINIGQHRCGVDDAPAVLRLLDALTAQPQLRFAGLQAYQGAIQHLRSHAERRAAAALAAERAGAVVAALAAAGQRCELVTGGGTGSVEFDLASGVYTEVQPGSYVFMDGDYGRNELAGALRFEHSLFLASTVMSVASWAHGRRCVLDAGLKSLATDSGLPAVWGQPQLRYVSANDEHGILESDNMAPPALGSQLLLVPGHCDPTLNLHDQLVAVRAGRVEALWEIAARGLSR